MSDKAIIQGCYADYRRVKGRKVLQLIVEVPLEEAPKVHEAFGEPTPDGSTWVAVALLDAQAPKPKEDKHKLSRQAAMCCEEARFWAFLTEYACDEGYSVPDSAFAARMVRKLCEVESRAELDTNPEAAEKWRNLYNSYQAWLLV